MITLDSKIQKGEKEKEMKNKKLWIFGGIILLIVILNHIFDWSSYISTAENLEFMKRIVQNNLPLAILLYMVLTVVGCVVLALPGVTFAILAGLLFGPVEDIVYRDTESYFGILYTNNNRKPICRLNLDTKNKQLLIPDENKKFERIYITSLNDIYKYKNKLIEVAKRYL